MSSRIMPLIFRPFLALLALGGAACSTLQIHSDHDPKANFSEYNTFAWAPEANSKPASDISGVPSQLMEDRIRAAIESQLQAKGLKPVKEGEKPDLLVREQLVQRQKIEGDPGYSLGLGYGYGPWYGAFGGPVHSSVRSVAAATLVIDLIDADTQRLVWRGIANDETAKPEESSQQVNEIVSEMLQRYPPKTVGQG